ncbi:magnesium transporter MgtE N-terminal domain-containing protein [Paenibacillus sacheonensis]|uniref:magnesium transporter MgtE N-terminal domain-containing protein n=1 Tax=Paenibacillus sacheonensis TaxID=742054 RepID=UPI0030844012
MEMEKQSYSGFERFMFFVTPILFTLILLGVLVTIFNINLRNKALEIGNDIPVLNRILPEPSVKDGHAVNEDSIKSANTSAKIAELQAQLTAKESELGKTVEEKTTLAKTVKDLQQQMAQLKQANAEQQLSDSAYQSKIGELASMYTSMTPSKAAPILESMETAEAVLVLDAMRPEDRAVILEKMNPKKAADASVLLKDTKTAKDRQIAALQARINKQQTTTTQSDAVLSAAQLNSTFSKMDPAAAADLLLKMSDVSPSKVLRILNAVDDAARSKILAEMSSANKAITAQLVSKLMVGK